MRKILLLATLLLFGVIGICQTYQKGNNNFKNQSFILTNDKMNENNFSLKNIPDKLEVNLADIEIENQLKSASSFYESELDYNFKFSDTISFVIQQDDTLKVRMYAITGTSIVGIGAMLKDTTQTEFELVGEDFLFAGYITSGGHMYYVYAVDFYIIANNSPAIGKYEHDLLTIAFKTSSSVTACFPVERKCYIDVIPNNHKTVDICEGDTYSLKNKNYNQSQVIYDTLTTSPSITTDVYKLTVHAVPEDPVITQDNGIISTTAVGNYQWYLENQKIEGATNQNLAVPKTGNYTLKITNDGGCSSQFSNTVYIVMTATNELKFTENISVYPNPYNDVINIKGLTGNETTIQVYDSFGKIAHTKNVISDSYSVNLSELPSGVYYLKLISEYGTTNYKIIKK